ncbi:N(4)-(beta-N-acetylglucosaminyl)-L-asparaginase [Flammeovirgaceae bacterium SG7u.111]|nr:N(4)-(beta-N-acetylglucosaminyl)-L-asparaginase [Flammeovirgaceae bacterium SG7u.132]WPO35726.1 N(4)-(beta-N-acetylglucosaminyl)-L-asparaginase [Flammeovirgaceae bacterium SG7u.111]
MKNNRRDFIKKSSIGLGLAGAGMVPLSACTATTSEKVGEEKAAKDQKVTKPIVISTWNHGQPANVAAWALLKEGKSALDAVEAGVRIPESDPEVRTVGLGGYPDRDGRVTLDACIMDHHSNCGSVAFLQDIVNPISVARKVMEDTPHVMLVGEGALQFAVEKGFERTNLLTEASKKDWENWLKESKYAPVINVENHDTISMLALDEEGNISGACTTSGASYKMHGRVGDSPIIGAGLFLDNEVGGACATGLGEAVIRVSGSAMVVEMMRQGASPQEACKAIVERIYEKLKDVENLQVGFLALDKKGSYGGYAIHKGFNYAVYSDESNNTLIDAESKFS